jgi:hypothetical protein
MERYYISLLNNFLEESLKKRLLNTILENQLRTDENREIKEYLKLKEANLIEGGESNVQNERSRIFSQLMNQMRKATKIITMLEKQMQKMYSD